MLNNPQTNAKLVLLYMKAAEEERVRQMERDEQGRTMNLAFIELNNLYLKIERGEKKLDIHNRNELYILLGRAYLNHDLDDWWMKEFQKLPRWNEI